MATFTFYAVEAGKAIGWCISGNSWLGVYFLSMNRPVHFMLLVVKKVDFAIVYHHNNETGWLS